MQAGTVHNERRDQGGRYSTLEPLCGLPRTVLGTYWTSGSRLTGISWLVSQVVNKQKQRSVGTGVEGAVHSGPTGVVVRVTVQTPGTPAGQHHRWGGDVTLATLRLQ